LERVKDLAIRTVDQTLEDGLDEDGGLMNETEPDVLKDTDKHWWPQAEAIIGLVNAWQLTGNGSYLDEAKSVWQFIKEKLIDRQHGEWHWRVNRQGEVNFDEEKAGFWKCPYHNGRMAIEVARRFGMLKR
jgi:mannobiose 2-epimerase